MKTKQNKKIVVLLATLALILVCSCISTNAVVTTTTTYNKMPLAQPRIDMPLSVPIGQAIAQTFCITNRDYSDVSTEYKIIRDLDSNEEYISSSPKGTLKYIDPNAKVGAYLIWGENIRVGEEICFEVVIKYKGLVELQELPQIVSINERTGKVASMSKTQYIELMCEMDGICDSSIGENYRTCSSDCPSGEADGICDGLYEGKCDPDCLTKHDFDCQIYGGGKKLPEFFPLEAPPALTKEEKAEVVQYDWVEINRLAEEIMGWKMLEIQKDAQAPGMPRIELGEIGVGIEEVEVGEFGIEIMKAEQPRGIWQRIVSTFQGQAILSLFRKN